MKQIEPIVFPFLGTATKIDVVITTFNVSSTICNTFNRLFDENDNLIYQWEYELTPDEYNSWESDNDYVINCVVKNKGITLI